MRHIFTLLLLLACLASHGASRLEGTPIASKAQGGHDASMAFDMDPSTSFRAQRDTYAFIGLDLGAPHVVCNVGLRADASGTPLLLGVVEGANSPDFSDGIPLAIVKEEPKAGEMLLLSINCSMGVRYVRYAGPAGSHGALAELDIYGTPGKGTTDKMVQLTNLPTLLIHTDNYQTPGDNVNDVPCHVTIVSEADGVQFFNKDAGFRERGNASRGFPKKPWRLKFDKKTRVLNSPAEAKKWTLINNYGDKTLMRNILAFETARKLKMDYVPFCRAVDVVVNGDYKGCYQLCDQIDVRPGRVDITEMTPDDTDGDALTGGYLFEIDAYALDGKEPVWFVTDRYSLPVTVKSPDNDAITAEQLNYLKAYVNMVCNSMPKGTVESGTYDAMPSGHSYREVFDVESFVKHMLVNEVAGNTDTYWSTYMWKERGDAKIHTGPVWDFDLGWDNDSRTYHVWRTSGDGFLWNSGGASAAGYMKDFARRVLTKDPDTAEEIAEQWRRARHRGLSAEWLTELINLTAQELDESQTLNFKRWPILNERIHQNPAARGSYRAEVDAVADYAVNQMAHLDKVMAYDPNHPYQPDPAEPGQPEPPTPPGGLDTPPSAAGAPAYVDGHSIIFAETAMGADYAIHAPTGRLVAAGRCGRATVELPAGIYILRVGASASKIIVGRR